MSGRQIPHSCTASANGRGKSTGLRRTLTYYHVRRYLKVTRTVSAEHSFKQTRRGRPGPNSAYQRITRRHYDLEWTVDQAAVTYDERSDGIYPLVSNDRDLTAEQVLLAHKGQPTIEKRFERKRPTDYRLAA